LTVEVKERKIEAQNMESPFVPTVTDFLKGRALFESFKASPARPYGNIMSLRRVCNTGGMILTGEGISTATKNLYNFHFVHQKLRGNGWGSIRGTCSEWSATNRLSRGKADKLTNFIYRFSWNVGASTSWNPQGTDQTCTAIALFHTKHFDFTRQRL